jgi:hypothetical protein
MRTALTDMLGLDFPTGRVQSLPGRGRPAAEVVYSMIES